MCADNIQYTWSDPNMLKQPKYAEATPLWVNMPARIVEPDFQPSVCQSQYKE